MCWRCKPVFHCISRLRWVPNTIKNVTNNMKSTLPMPGPRVGDPTQPIFHLRALRVCVRGNANCRVHVGGKIFEIPTCWYPQRKILTLGILPNANLQREGFCVAVEYRHLKVSNSISHSVVMLFFKSSA